MRFIIVLALLCPFLSFTQPVALDKPGKSANKHIPGLNQPLTIGAIVPDITLRGIVNGASPNARLSSFGRELLILDFWATWCTACLHNFPKLDSLQRQFAGSFGVLLVNGKSTGDTEARVKAFFQKRRAPGGKLFALPTLVEDTVLSALFPHKFIPHYVWLNKNLQVLAITGSEELTAGNIRKAIAGEGLGLPLKKDILDYDPARPLFQEGNGGDPSLATYRSLFTGYIEGLGTGASRREEGGSRRYTYRNHSVLQLYAAALPMQPNRVLLRGLDTTRFFTTAPTNAWMRQNAFCYELTLPATATRARADSLTLQDLNRYLGLQSRIEKQTLSCWVLVHTGAGSQPLQSGGGKPRLVWPGEGQPKLALQNKPLSALIDALNSGIPGEPPGPVFLDESGITIPVNLELEASPASIPALNKALAPYGLAFRQATRLLEVFVLTPQ